MIQGLDISHNNTVNFSHFSPEFKFVIMKASQGKGFHDPMFQLFWKACKAKGLIHGAYHFLTFQDTAQAQADNFLSRGIDWSLPGVLPPVLDIEDQVGKNALETKQLNQYILNNRQRSIDLIFEWLSIIETKTGRVPIVYSYKGFFSEYLHNPVDFSKYLLWVASYQNKEPGLPPMWSKYTFWQYTQYGKLDGTFTQDPQEAQKTGAEIDLDYFNGTIEELNQLANL